MDKTEAIAGLLSTLHGSDRRWILRRLPVTERRRLHLALKRVPTDLSKLREDIRALIRAPVIEGENPSPSDAEALESRRRLANPILVDLPRDLQVRIREALELMEGPGREVAPPTALARAAMIRHLPGSGTVLRSEPRA